MIGSKARPVVETGLGSVSAVGHPPTAPSGSTERFSGAVSVSFKTSRGSAAYRCRMSPRFDAIGLVVSDMAASVSFYRLLGFTFPEGAEHEPHTEAELPGGLRLLLDTEDTVRSFNPGWQPPSGGGRTSLALRCDTPGDVDTVYEELLGASTTEVT